jgi:uncharacterized membrane protein SpoIIM required for sporulation
VYARRRPLRESLADFFLRRFPGAVRAHAAHLAVAAVLLLLGTLAGFALTRGDADRFYSFVDTGLAQGRGPTSSSDSLRRALYAEPDAAKMLSTFAMFLFSHNSRVGLLAFALGVAGGGPTALLMFANGLTLGAFAALYHGRGLGLDFWAWVLPHGVTELLAVSLCGAAGLAVAQALLFPGRATRRERLAARGREAALVALGAIALLFAAGLIEGIFRQLVHSVPVRLSVAASSALLWGLYFAAAGRRPQ